VLTRFTDDPQAMQLLQLAIALGTWWLVLRCSPFTAGDGCCCGVLPVLGYFVLARMYGLGALRDSLRWRCASGRQRRVRCPGGAGLLANTSVFGCCDRSESVPAGSRRQDAGAARGAMAYRCWCSPRWRR
jgi:hypothetical protein